MAAEAWGTPATLEGQIVKLADSIAYLNHDIDDAIRAGLIAHDELPEIVRTVLGVTHSQRIDRLVSDCVTSSWEVAQGGAGRVALSPGGLEATDALRAFMFERVYLVEETLEQARRGQRVVEALFRHYETHPAQIPGYALPGDAPWRRAADYVSGMTDGYALRRARELGLAPAGGWGLPESA